MRPKWPLKGRLVSSSFLTSLLLRACATKAWQVLVPPSTCGLHPRGARALVSLGARSSLIFLSSTFCQLPLSLSLSASLVFPPVLKATSGVYSAALRKSCSCDRHLKKAAKRKAREARKASEVRRATPVHCGFLCPGPERAVGAGVCNSALYSAL